MHATGFEPVMFLQKADYESAAFDHSAMHAFIYFLSKKSNNVLLCEK